MQRCSAGTDLNARLVQLRDAGQFLATVNVRVVALRERRFQLLQLFLRERGAVSAAGRSRRTRGRAHGPGRRVQAVAADSGLDFELLERASCD